MAQLDAAIGAWRGAGRCRRQTEVRIRVERSRQAGKHLNRQARNLLRILGTRRLVDQGRERALTDARIRIAHAGIVRVVSLGIRGRVGRGIGRGSGWGCNRGIDARALERRKMAGQGTAGRVLDKVVRIDRLHAHGLGRCRRQAHRSRDIQRQVEIEICGNEAAAFE